MNKLEERSKRLYEEKHKLINGILFRKCTICNQWFPCTLEYFYKNKKYIHGLMPYCKKCNTNKIKNWQKK